ncbi:MULTISPECIES: acetamidase/formamidase family protein [unclassified Aureimonas]|uniref:acetamidase/formamidase family protein n=1 Tax=unclassified Aureimonas TaxID=2615206 RepID=UPI000701B364|nr:MULTISPECIES: acetamidase/formamidase family protein [unclassified Aureimonas]KQT62926.1 acetamidase [Aureimonas sp. Leaf427]KQT74837.1 acetamidase [Aureimonas sp. Leaf460]
MTTQFVDKVDLKYEFSAKDACVARVEPGEEFTVACEMAYNGGLVTSLDAVIRPEDFRYPFFNPMTGPIEIKGAKAGQMLCVRIKEMELEEFGLTGLAPHSGLFQEWIFERQERFSQFKPVRVSDGVIHWSEKLKIPIVPMAGVIGVAPAFGSILSLDNGEHGGNIDVQEMGPGCTVYLPVNVDGGYLYIGDCHARQGDGEVCGMGAIDIGARLTLSVDVQDRPTRMTWPRFETDSHIGTVGLGRPLEDAMRVAYREMIYWLADEHGFTEADAYMLLSSVAEGRATQIMNPKSTFICKVEKSLLV